MRWEPKIILDLYFWCSLLFFLTCEQLSDLYICGFPQQSDQRRYPSTVLQSDLVVVIGFAVHQVPQGSAGAAVHIRHSVIQQVDEQLDATLPPDLQTEGVRKELEGMDSEGVCQTPPCRASVYIHMNCGWGHRRVVIRLKGEKLLCFCCWENCKIHLPNINLSLWNKTKNILWHWCRSISRDGYW